MAAKKKSVRRATRSAVRNTRGRLARTWQDTREALELGQAAVQKQVSTLMKRSGVDARKAGEMLLAFRHSLDLERRRAIRQLEARLLVVQARAKKERRVLGRAVDDAVRGTLAALNIPSRQEVHELTRRVEELSRKIDSFRKTPSRRPSTRAVASA